MGEVGQIDVKFDRKAFNVVLRTFSFMRDNWGAPGIVDPAALFISQQDAAESLPAPHCSARSSAPRRPAKR